MQTILSSSLMERKQSAAKYEVSEVSWLGRSKRREKKLKWMLSFSGYFLGHLIFSAFFSATCTFSIS